MCQYCTFEHNGTIQKSVVADRGRLNSTKRGRLLKEKMVVQMIVACQMNASGTRGARIIDRNVVSGGGTVKRISIGWR